MKGIVFTEFLEMVEQQFGYELVDELIVESNLPSGGSYTSVGTYPHSEMVALIVGLSKKTNAPVPNLLRAFGRHLFRIFSTAYPQFFEKANDAFSFLESIENYIHVEVLKLYPDAELPRFQTQRLSDGSLEMVYLSERSMADLAEGLIESCIDYFKESADIQRVALQPDGRQVRFIISKK